MSPREVPTARRVCRCKRHNDEKPFGRLDNSPAVFDLEGYLLAGDATDHVARNAAAPRSQ